MKASIFVFIVAIVLLLTKITEQYTKFHKEDLKKNNLPNIGKLLKYLEIVFF